MNPLDRVPTPPPGIEPHTFDEMVDLLFERLRTDLPEEEACLRGRAWQAVRVLVAHGAVQLWGMKDGEPTWVPVVRREVYRFSVERIAD
jgi:hypothetical protein